MIGYLIRRILQTIIVLFFVTVFTLFLVHLFPGGPIKAMLGQRATPQQVAYYTHIYGFDQPFYVQFIKWIGQLLHGNLGFSNKLNMSVGGLIAQDLPKTIILVLLRTFVSPVFGIPLGLYQAVRRYTIADCALAAVPSLGYATRTFFVGLLLVEWFSVDVHLLPPFAPQGTSVGKILSQPTALILPVISYSFVL